MPANQPTLYIIYNAKSTLFGKVDYAYRKLTRPDSCSRPACAACELTHGPSLSLTESPEWAAAKARIRNVTVAQVHTDEQPAGLARWMEEEGVETPAVVVEAAKANDGESGSFQMLLTSEDLARVRRDYGRFLEALRERAREVGVEGLEVDVP
ncbi:hypothetical protein PHISP_05992 [Aspergillus sp. HF37]|nr:hypothetical protein PHISP_05992 [Aspergillus sp. HF37]